MKESLAIREALKHRPDLLRRIAKHAVSINEVPPGDTLIIFCGMWPSNIDGSRRDTCARCTEYVSVAPSTIEMLKTRTGTVELLCLGCGIGEVENQVATHKRTLRIATRAVQ